MASIDSTINVTVRIVGFEQRDMNEEEFKDWLVRTLREAINERDVVIIQPGSNQALILKDDEEDVDEDKST